MPELEGHSLYWRITFALTQAKSGRQQVRSLRSE